MGSRLRVKPLLLFIFMLQWLVLAALAPCAYAKEGGETFPRPPLRFDTRYAAVYYTDTDDLLTFGKKISTGLSFLMRNRGNALIGTRDDVDRIISRVSDILDMHPNNLYFSVNIYKDYVEITVAYREFSATGKSPVAFYAHRTKTIYVNLDKLNDGIFAHETAHAIISIYFGSPPPAKMQEILAQHVDRHLWDE